MSELQAMSMMWPQGVNQYHNYGVFVPLLLHEDKVDHKQYFNNLKPWE